MLEAISKMLDQEDMTPDNTLVKIGCAKVILDKVIDGLPETTATVQIPSVFSPSLVADMPTAVTTTTTKPKVKIPDGKYKIVKDSNNKLVRIDGLALDGKVELDGKIMTHAEARGKVFISGRII